MVLEQFKHICKTVNLEIDFMPFTNINSEKIID